MSDQRPREPPRDVLARILEATRRDNERLRAAPPVAIAHRPIDVRAALARNGGALRLIAEIKHRSPSAGPLSRALAVEERARAYAAAGANMISVLVDREHFDGGYDQLARARAAVSLPLLAKGFTLEEVQLDAARAAGADAVLVIVRILDDRALTAMVTAARHRGLEPIVEVVDEEELDRALAASARVVGVNARDLATLKMDPERAARVVDRIPRDVVSLWFSGLSSAADVARVARRPIDGALVGEVLMRLDDPTAALAELVAAASTAAPPALRSP